MSRKILKKSHDKMLGGVCAGIAEYLGWQASQVRILFVLIAFFAGSGLLAYLILFFVMPGPDSGNDDGFNLNDFRE